MIRKVVKVRPLTTKEVTPGGILVRKIQSFVALGVSIVVKKRKTEVKGHVVFSTWVGFVGYAENLSPTTISWLYCKTSPDALFEMICRDHIVS